ncbi:PaaI family thioesterase [Aestuariicella hydrocarbonica]|uniref:PaaI family thioesterase n=1 Tax=Pseudomaricurvus hydrocarbonicus TaxID=1470433 RepID=A0A9E5JPV6_9GAMM|nr:PaaI family thioesterase [Aestuariicella hydrocarbonica]
MSTIAQLVENAQKNGDWSPCIEAIPYARLLGIQLSEIEAGVFCLPPKKSNIGNPTLPALHGGALGGFMEMSAIFHLMMSMEVHKVPKVVDFSIDYLRPGHFKNTYARCEIVRFGRKLVNVGVDSWQDDSQKLVARARAQFLID